MMDLLKKRSDNHTNCSTVILLKRKLPISMQNTVRAVLKTARKVLHELFVDELTESGRERKIEQIYRY